MSNDTKFIDGLIFKAPHENAPDYVIAKISIKRAELIAWLQSQTGDWINADLKESQQGKLYAAVDDWKPGSNGGSSGTRGGAPQRERPVKVTDTDAADNGFAEEDIPFLSQRGNF